MDIVGIEPTTSRMRSERSTPGRLLVLDLKLSHNG